MNTYRVSFQGGFHPEDNLRDIQKAFSTISSMQEASEEPLGHTKSERMVNM